MEKYYVDKNSTDKVYGIFDYLSLGNNTKTLGGVNKDKYLFEIGIYDHYVSHNDIDDEIGEKDFYISTYSEADFVELYIEWMYNDRKENVPNDFEYECVLGILNECLEYKKINNIDIKVIVSDSFFIDREERCSNNIQTIINDINNYMNKGKTK